MIENSGEDERPRIVGPPIPVSVEIEKESTGVGHEIDRSDDVN